MSLLPALLSRGFVLIIAAWGFCYTAAAQTGDATIDGWIAPYSSYRGGNNLAPGDLQPANYSIFNACNSPQAPAEENNCPSDLTYTPLAGAGGYQAFGAGVLNLPEDDYWQTVCYWYWYYDWNLDHYVFQFVCDWYYLGHFDAHTIGTAGARVRFSQLNVYTAAGIYQPLSTLAFKSADTHWNLDHLFCYPQEPGETAPCAPWQQNAYVVPFSYPHTPPNPGAGYEDKIHLANPSCPSWWIRFDTSVDRYANCFSGYDSSWWSDFPAAYADTTVFDPGETFIAAVGSAQPWAIQEGYTYSWKQDFWAWGYQNLLWTTARHVGAVAMYFPDELICNGTPPLCFFNVDQTRIAPDALVQ